MADWDDTPEEILAWRDEWMEEYGIDWKNSIAKDDLDAANYAKLVKLDKKKLVWTNHSTCEDDFFTTGLHVFGDCAFLKQKSSGCGCWQSHSFIIAKKPWSDENERITATAYLPCSVCNPDGEEEGVEGCKGPETPEGSDRGDCEGGFINWYFD